MYILIPLYCTMFVWYEVEMKERVKEKGEKVMQFWLESETIRIHSPPLVGK